MAFQSGKAALHELVGTELEVMVSYSSCQIVCWSPKYLDRRLGHNLNNVEPVAYCRVLARMVR